MVYFAAYYHLKFRQNLSYLLRRETRINSYRSHSKTFNINFSSMIFKLIVFAYPYGQPQAVSKRLKFIIFLVQTSVFERMYFRRVIIEWALSKFRRTSSHSRQINLKIKVLPDESFFYNKDSKLLSKNLLNLALGSALNGTNMIIFFFHTHCGDIFLSIRNVWLFSSTVAHLPCLHCKFQASIDTYRALCVILHVNINS